MAKRKTSAPVGETSNSSVMEMHRHSSFSSTASNYTDHDRSPIESPVPPTGYDILQRSKVDPMTLDLDDDGDSGENAHDSKLTKRDIHTLNEQKRRDLIKQGYSQLADIVPTCKPTSSGTKPSRAIILQRSIEYIMYLHNQGIKQREQLEDLEKEVQALRIMKDNYEQIAKSHQSRASSSVQQVPDHIKFLVFQGISDQLFQSFNSSISVASFETLSSCIISWLEEYCKPQTLREIVLKNLRQVDAMNLSGPVTNSTYTANSTHSSVSHRTN